MWKKFKFLQFSTKIGLLDIEDDLKLKQDEVKCVFDIPCYGSSICNYFYKQLQILKKSRNVGPKSAC